MFFLLLLFPLFLFLFVGMCVGLSQLFLFFSKLFCLLAYFHRNAVIVFICFEENAKTLFSLFHGIRQLNNYIIHFCLYNRCSIYSFAFSFLNFEITSRYNICLDVICSLYHAAFFSPSKDALVSHFI